MLKSLKAPVFSSLDQPFPRYTYQTDLSEAVNLNGGNWAPNGSGMVFHLSCKLVNGANNDRVLYNNSNTATGTRISLVHTLDRVTVIPIEGIPAISFTFPDGTLDANGLCDLWVFVDNARGNVVCTLNGETIQALGSFTPGGVIYYDQITGGGGSNRLEAQLYNIDLFDSSAIQNRWVTNGDGVNGYIKTPPVDLPEDFLLSLNYTRKGGTSNEPILAGDYTSDVYINHSVSSLSFWYLGVTYNFGYIVATGSTVGIKCGVSNGRVFGFIDDVQLIDEPVVPETLTNVEIWLLGAANLGAKSDDSVSNFKVYTDGVAQRSYAIDESSGDNVYDTISGQNGTRVNMDASNFEFIPNHNQRFRFAELEEGQSILPAQLGDLEVRITSYRAAGFKPA